MKKIERWSFAFSEKEIEKIIKCLGLKIIRDAFVVNRTGEFLPGETFIPKSLMNLKKPTGNIPFGRWWTGNLCRKI